MACSPWLERLSARSQAALEGAARSRHFEAGQMVYGLRDRTVGLHLVTSGSMAMSLIATDGRTLLLDILRAGRSFGGIGALDGGAARVFVTARTEAEVLYVRNADLAGIRAAHPDVSAALIRHASSLVRTLLHLVEEYALMPLGDRAVSRLRWLASRTDPGGGDPVALDVTQSELAAMLGASRRATNRVLAELQARGLVECGFKSIGVMPSLLTSGQPDLVDLEKVHVSDVRRL